MIETWSLCHRTDWFCFLARSSQVCWFIRAYKEGFVQTLCWRHSFAWILKYCISLCWCVWWKRQGDPTNIFYVVCLQREPLFLFTSCPTESHLVVVSHVPCGLVWLSLSRAKRVTGMILPWWDPRPWSSDFEHLGSSVGCWCIWYSACLPVAEKSLQKNKN